MNNKEIILNYQKQKMLYNVKLNVGALVLHSAVLSVASSGICIAMVAGADGAVFVWRDREQSKEREIGVEGRGDRDKRD